MNKRLLTLCMLLAAVTVGTVAATVTINSTNFPDANFRAFLKAADFNNGDNYLTDAEIKEAGMLEVNEMGITNLKGIEFFTSMWFLDCSDNDLQSLDVSKNTALTMLACANNKLQSLDVSKNTNLGFLACYNNKLTALDLSKNTALTELDCFLNQIKGESMDALIASLPQGTDCEFVAVSDGDLELNVCTGPQATTAKQKGWNLSCWYCNSFVANPFEGGVTINAYNFPDVTFRSKVLSLDTDADGMLADKDIQAVKYLNLNWAEGYEKIKDLTGIEHFTALKELYCHGNSLKSLDVSNNTALTYLDCSYNYGLRSLDVSNNTALMKLDCSDTYYLESLDISNCTALTYLDCEYHLLKSLDVTNCTALTTLNCWGGRIESLDVSKCTALKELSCGSNSLTSLDVSKNTKLKELKCNYNALTSLDVSKNTALTRLYCGGNQIEGSNMDKMVNSLPDTQGTLGVCKDGENPDNVITKAQVKVATDKGWKVQKYTKDENNMWAYVDYAGVSVDIPIDATNFPDEKFRNYLLSQDYGNDGILTEDEIKSVNFLALINLGIKDLTGIEYFYNVTFLSFSENQVETIDLSKNTELLTLLCISNKLKTLDVSKNTKLRGLYCDDNQLKALDLSKNTQLNSLQCNDNQIYGAQMDALIASMPTVESGSFVAVSDKATEKNTCTMAQVEAAKQKGWSVSWKTGDTWMAYAGCDAGIPIDATTFPDDNFRNYVSTKADVNKNGILSDDEIKEVQEIQVTSKSIKNLKGIEYFTALTSLYCVDNKLTTLGVSKNTSLTTIACYSNLIKGAQMDALIASLPTVSGGRLCVIDPFDDSEQNVCTIAQVIAAKKKGWNVLKWMDPMSYPYGDVNGDDVVDKKDLNALASYIVGEYDGFVADIDINNDGKTDAADIVALVNILNGK